MTARPVGPESRRPVSAAVALVLLLAMAMVAGCVSYPRNGLCGGEFEVYGLADFQKPDDNVVHLTEQDFKENPELDEVLRGAKRTNATCYNKYFGFRPCIGGSWYECGGKARLIKYSASNKTPDFKNDRILEYGGKFYYLEFTIVA